MSEKNQHVLGEYVPLEEQHIVNVEINKDATA